jgi:L-gulonate 3-dehydrogenase
MMRRMGADARTDYNWTREQITDVHDKLAADIPIADIPVHQRQRDRRILDLLRLREQQDRDLGDD